MGCQRWPYGLGCALGSCTVVPLYSEGISGGGGARLGLLGRPLWWVAERRTGDHRDRPDGCRRPSCSGSATSSSSFCGVVLDISHRAGDRSSPAGDQRPHSEAAARYGLEKSHLLLVGWRQVCLLSTASSRGRSHQRNRPAGRRSRPPPAVLRRSARARSAPRAARPSTTPAGAARPARPLRAR